MKLLLDTNVFLWASLEPELLSGPTRLALTDPYNERFVSVVSLWEMQIKHSLGKLPLPSPVDELGRTWLTELAAGLVPIELKHLGALYELPPIHKDPFDRLLIAQAISGGMTILTSDDVFRLYPAQVLV